MSFICNFLDLEWIEFSLPYSIIDFKDNSELTDVYMNNSLKKIAQSKNPPFFLYV